MAMASMSAISLGGYLFLLELANREGKPGMRIVYLIGTASLLFSIVYNIIDIWNHK